ncbi:hypothetical protein C5167_002922 [Papaver somniferum]|uniref:Uncharacterized protein n=1 Tax=Papaver somniferum TaxID=3469 RepID=A0A4Y7KWF0_PAPSO|nr:hypothetical protein C5167_002922 [Papaver somniferum]
MQMGYRSNNNGFIIRDSGGGIKEFCFNNIMIFPPNTKDSDGLKETSNQCSCGVVFNWSNDAKGLTKTSVQEYEDVHKSLKTLCESQSGKQEQC